jgi:hypothetical protein
LELFFKRYYVGTNFIPNHGLVYCCNMFQVLESNKLIGQFFSGGNIAFIATVNDDIKIEKEFRLLKKNNYKIINQKNKEELGNYFIPKFFSLTAKFGILFFNHKEYAFHVSYSSHYLKKGTCFYFEAKLWLEDEYVTYTFAISDKGSYPPIENGPFGGKIEYHTKNYLLIYLGLYLLESNLTVIDTTVNSS